MKKIFFAFAFMFIALLLLCPISNSNSFSHALHLGEKATVISSRCNLYASADFTSDKIMILDGENERIYYLTHNEEVDVLQFEGDFVKVLTVDDIEGWAYKYYLTQNKSQTIYPVFNGTIRSDSILYDMDLQNSGFSVKKDQRVFIYKSFSEKENYTSVQVVLDDQSLYNGYVLTKDVQPDGISGLLIAGISTIVAGVTIVLSVVFMKKKKKRSK